MTAFTPEQMAQLAEAKAKAATPSPSPEIAKLRMQLAHERGAKKFYRNKYNNLLRTIKTLR